MIIPDYRRPAKYLALGIGLSTLCAPRPIAAQLVPDANWGESASRIRPEFLDQQTIDLIEGGAQRGNNLFHSFVQFNIDANQRVYFASPNSIQNIFTRVIGGTSSNIQGVLGVAGNANLFLLNPSGMLFGPNAQLDVRGSFVGTTASAVEFGNQGSFMVTQPNAPPLLTIQPSALQFAQAAASPIINQSVAPAGATDRLEQRLGLRVANNKSLMLLGGDIEMNDGKLNAFGGRIELGGLAAPGRVELTFADDRIQAQFPPNVPRSNIRLQNNADLFVQGNSGEILIHANRFDVLDGSQLLGGLSTPNQATASGNIVINANLINFVSQNTERAAGIFLVAEENSVGQLGDVILNASQINWGTRSWLRNQVYRGSRANSGNILINADNLQVSSQEPRENFNALGQIGIQHDGIGNIGNLQIRLQDRLRLDNGLIFVQNASTGSPINATKGYISIQASVVEVLRGSQIETNTQNIQDSGNLEITARESITIAGKDPRSNDPNNQFFSNLIARTSGNGTAGNIRLNAPEIRILDDGLVVNQVEPDGTGRGGLIQMDAAKSILLRQDAKILSNIFGNASGSNIEIFTPNLSIQNGSAINTSTFSSNPLVKGGDLKIDAEFIEISGVGNQLSRRETDTVGQRTPSTVSASARSNIQKNAIAQGGDVFINTGQLIVTNKGVMGTGTSSQGNSGNLTINARDRVLVEGSPDNQIEGIPALNGPLSIISTETFGGGNAGDLTINTPRLIVRNTGLISSRAFFDSTGESGDLTINAAEQVDIGASVPGSYASAVLAETSGSGGAGTLTINTLRLNVYDGGSVRTAATIDSTGNGSDLVVNAQQINITNQGELNANTNGAGRAGNIRLAASITKLDQGRITTVSNSQDGGNISIQDHDIVLLRRGSQITTQAGTNQAGSGKGGDIKINTNFLVALPQENSFITANSFGGSGGQLQIQAESILGIRLFARPELEQLFGADRLSNTDVNTLLQLIPSSITNISQTSPNLSGAASVQILTTDPSQGATDLPTEAIDATRKVMQICPRSSGRQELGSFVVTGRGSLPPNPLENSDSQNIIPPLAKLDQKQLVAVPSIAPPKPIIEAQDWQREPDGKIRLLARKNVYSPSPRMGNLAGMNCAN